MGLSLTYKILKEHLLKGDLTPGNEVAIKIDQTLTQDSTGTMVYLQLEAMDVSDIQTESSVAYIDHNMLQTSFENADDHTFIQSAAEKYGITFSKPGGGICHQVHLEKFAIPGKTLIGSDSHTPTAGGLGSFAMGAGGLDVAVGMAGGYYYLQAPEVYNIELIGELQGNTNAKDVILHVLRKLGVKGGIGNVLEYTGPGIKSLSVTDRATICNMGAELGATTSIFPSDENTLDYLTRRGRPEDYVKVEPDANAHYDYHMLVDLNEIRPSIAKPHSPDNITEISNLKNIKVNQVAIGSCTNSSFSDLMRAAEILKGNKVHPDIDLVITPGSPQVLQAIIESGALGIFISAGARILESGCGPCIGMGQAPQSGGVSVRSFNRNFRGRSGTFDSEVYLASPETCAATAIRGEIVDPNDLAIIDDIVEPEKYPQMEHYLIYPVEKSQRRQDTVMGPNIKPFPETHPLEDELSGAVLLKAGDNITTDDICPSDAGLLPFRSNIPHLANFAFRTLIPDFKQRALDHDGGFIVGGDNYGQGSSREHAALIPLELKIKGVVAKSFARIHRSNLINSGILPLVFVDEADYDLIDEYDDLRLENLLATVGEQEILTLRNESKNIDIPVRLRLSDRELAILIQGGYLNYAKNHHPSDESIKELV